MMLHYCLIFAGIAAALVVSAIVGWIWVAVVDELNEMMKLND